MAMIGAIVLARRDVSIPTADINDLKNQKSLSDRKVPLLSENSIK